MLLGNCMRCNSPRLLREIIIESSQAHIGNSRIYIFEDGTSMRLFIVK